MNGNEANIDPQLIDTFLSGAVDVPVIEPVVGDAHVSPDETPRPGLSRRQLFGLRPVTDGSNESSTELIPVVAAQPESPLNDTVAVESKQRRPRPIRRLVAAAGAGVIVLLGSTVFIGDDSGQSLRTSTTAEPAPVSTETPTTSTLSAASGREISTVITIEPATTAAVSETTTTALPVDTLVVEATVPADSVVETPVEIAPVETAAEVVIDTVPIETPPVQKASPPKAAAVNKSPNNCPEPDTVITLGPGLPYFDYLMGLGLTKNQVDHLLSGTNFSEKYGLDLKRVIAGQEACLPTSAAEILGIWTSVAAITT